MLEATTPRIQSTSEGFMILVFFFLWLILPVALADLFSQLKRNHKKKGRIAGEWWGQTTQHRPSTASGSVCPKNLTLLWAIVYFAKAHVFVEQPAVTETVIYVGPVLCIF